MGFQYELSEQFAKSLGVKLRIEVARNVHELIELSLIHIFAAPETTIRSTRYPAFPTRFPPILPKTSTD